MSLEGYLSLPAKRLVEFAPKQNHYFAQACQVSHLEMIL
jgi:hypothetical protein